MALPQAQVVDLTQILLQAQSPDASVRVPAEQHLQSFRDSNFPSFLVSLSTELATPAKPVDSRRLAGLYLKNLLDARDEARKADLQRSWVVLDVSIKEHTRAALLATLQSEPLEIRQTASLVIAKVAAIELPRKEWPQLINALLSVSGAQAPGTPPGSRQAAIQSLGYVCEEMASIPDEVLTPEEVNMILTAVAAGMAATEPDVETRLFSTKALCNAIEFARQNFENDSERNYLMQVICAGTVAPDARIRSASFECLHEIASLYYSKLPAYMMEIFNITVKAIKEDTESVGLQAIEFWCTVCDTELDLIEENDPKEPCQQFIAAACPHLVPILLTLLTKQEEEVEDEDTTWNLAMAAGTCLGLMARVAGDAVVPLVMPFVTENISKASAPEDWRLREAATFAFGSVLDGPSPVTLLLPVQQGLGFLLQALKDPHPYVKDTTAWTIGRILEFMHSPYSDAGLITRDNLPILIQALVTSLADAPHIAYRVCVTLGNLASGFRGSENAAFMSPYFKDIIAALLQTSHTRAAFEHAKVQLAAYEAINEFVRSASTDTLDIVAQLLPVFLTELHKTFEMAAASPDAREKQSEAQGLVCGALQVIMSKLSESDVTKTAVVTYGDALMEAILRIFQAQSAAVHEEAMLAVGTFTYAVGKGFIKYLPQFYPYLRIGLSNHQEWQVCLATIGVLGDCCRNVEADVAPWCDELMSILVDKLGREDVHRSIKPQILSCVGDVALAIGNVFEKYLDTVRRMLMQAMQLSITQASSGDDEFIEYNNSLREGILDAYTGLFTGLGAISCQMHLSADVPAIVEFISSIGREQELEPAVVKAAVCLLADLCMVLRGVGQALAESPLRAQWMRLVAFCREDELQEECEWAVQQIEAAVGM